MAPKNILLKKFLVLDTGSSQHDNFPFLIIIVLTGKTGKGKGLPGTKQVLCIDIGASEYHFRNLNPK